jgi:hypothetical protein
MTEDIYFTGSEHKQRFSTEIQRIGKIDEGQCDVEYATALYILTSRSSTWNKASGYVSNHGIDFQEMLEQEDWSGGYSNLIKLAGNLFNSSTKVDTAGVAELLDEENFKLAMDAFKIRRYGLSLGTLQTAISRS